MNDNQFAELIRLIESFKRQSDLNDSSSDVSSLQIDVSSVQSDIAAIRDDVSEIRKLIEGHIAG